MGREFHCAMGETDVYLREVGKTRAVCNNRHCKWNPTGEDIVVSTGTSTGPYAIFEVDLCGVDVHGVMLRK